MNVGINHVPHQLANVAGVVKFRFRRPKRDFGVRTDGQRSAYYDVEYDSPGRDLNLFGTGFVDWTAWQDQRLWRARTSKSYSHVGNRRFLVSLRVVGDPNLGVVNPASTRRDVVNYVNDKSGNLPTYLL